VCASECFCMLLYASVCKRAACSVQRALAPRALVLHAPRLQQLLRPWRRPVDVHTLTWGVSAAPPHAHIRGSARTHTCLHLQAHAHAHMHAHTLARSAHMHACTHTNAHACMHACTHARIHAHTHTCTRARTHTHAPQ